LKIHSQCRPCFKSTHPKFASFSGNGRVFLFFGITKPISVINLMMTGNDAENKTKAIKRGLWSEPEPIPLWEWRKIKTYETNHLVLESV